MTTLPMPISSTRRIAGGAQPLRITALVPAERAGDALEHVGGHVEVRVDGVHVVEVLERVAG